MASTEPAPIREHYIAYMDLLGYKNFFQENPDRVPEFLDSIHAAIESAQAYISQLNISPLLSASKMEFKTKIFSDNILICLEAINDELYKPRLLALLKLSADIQRNFITRYGLFLRGGITKGAISFNDDYVFGQGIIDAVDLEGKANYPRIIIDEQLIACLREIPPFLTEKAEEATIIRDKLVRSEGITELEQHFWEQYQSASFATLMIIQLANLYTSKWPDDVNYLSYLGGMLSPSLPNGVNPAQILAELKRLYPSDYDYAVNNGEDIDKSLLSHKEQVEKMLNKYGNYEGKEKGCVPECFKVMRKYIWSMTYHNLVCRSLNKLDYFISTRANFNVQHIMPTIEVIPDVQVIEKKGEIAHPSESSEHSQP